MNVTSRQSFFLLFFFSHSRLTGILLIAASVVFSTFSLLQPYPAWATHFQVTEPAKSLIETLFSSTAAQTAETRETLPSHLTQL